MVMEDNEQPPVPITEASAPQVEDRPLWDLSRDDQRVLIITFVGGLASLVAGASVIGGAIALVQGLRAIHHTLGLLIFLIFLTAVDIFVMVWGFKARRSLPRPWKRHVLSGGCLFGWGPLYCCWSGSVWLRASTSAVSVECPVTLLPGPDSLAGSTSSARLR
jgi:type III secretory pathway component EscS